ncbi:MAG TPA: hypothetical protein VHW69_17415 [Rhizomicrobium sp.]|nr:hypothetical protein [Rhizomicrobium sp.]
MAATYSDLGESGAALAESEAVARSLWHRISWGAIFAGAVVGTAVIFFLLMLGMGVGLSLVPAHRASTGFLTLGAIYFLAAQAMGFAVGGHIVGRLIGPMAETDPEEEFRAAIHGLTVWGLCVIATALVVLATGWVTAGSSALAGAPGGAYRNSADVTPSAAAYWTDVLLRPGTAPMHASAAWQRYAQADTTATDAPPAVDDESATDRGFTAKPMTAVPPGNGKVENDLPKASHEEGVAPSAEPSEPSAAPHVITIPVEGDNGEIVTDTGAAQPPRHDIAADRAELGRMIEVGMTNGGGLSSYDRDRAVQLVAQDTGLPTAEAARRVDNARARIRADETRIVETARKIARNASLWIALALLFGAIVAAMAAVSARWEDDRITFDWRPRRRSKAL